MKDKEMTQALAQGNGTAFCEIRFGPACFVKPVSETVVTPEPGFEEVKHLYSDKPLKFNQPPKLL